MEEPVLMSDEETSDSEVIFVDNSPPPSEARGKRTQSKVVTEEMRIDEQLKEMGMFEEGMNLEQKQELLAVLAASRETAEQEESMRQKAMEWERRLFSDVDDISPYEAPNEDDDNWKSDGSKTTTTGYGRNSLPVIDANKGSKCFTVNRAEESYSQKMKLTEKAFKMLDVEESSKTSESQDQKSTNTSAISADTFYSQSGDLSFPVSGNSQRRQVQYSQRRKHLSRSAYRPLSPSSSKVAVAHPMIRDSGSEMVVRDEDSSSFSPADFHRIKFKLEKSLSSWKPCTSPVTYDLPCRRASPKNNADKDYVPFFCPENCNPKEYTAVILNSFRKFHRLLRKVQARSRTHIQWGEPVKVGRHHLDSLDAMTPRHQVKVSNSDRLPTRLSNRSNVEVNYAELENKECNEDSAMMNIDNCPEPEPDSSDSNNVVRTLKSAFRPIKTPLQIVDKENDSVPISDYELHENECSKSDTLPRSKSCPSPVASDSNAVAEFVGKSKRTLLSDLSYSKDLEEPGGEENSSSLNEWSPFGPSSAMLLNSEVPSFNAFSTYTANNTTPSFDSLLHSEAGDNVNKKTEASELENNICDSQYHVRKDGQKTYSSRLHHKSKTFGRCDSSQGTSGESNHGNGSKCVSSAEASSSLKSDEVLISQIEEGGISRKRKCELRLTRLTPSEIRAACPRKRWKK